MKLTKEESRSQTWVRIEELLTAELARLRGLNDDTQKDEIKTAVIRGRIKQLKEVLAMGKETPPQEAAPPVDFEEF